MNLLKPNKMNINEESLIVLEFEVFLALMLTLKNGNRLLIIYQIDF